MSMLTEALEEPRAPEPDWLAALRVACEQSSQARVAQVLRQEDGYPSPATVNQALSGRYQHPTDRLAALVRGVYLDEVVECPVLGVLRLHECLAHQHRPFASTNPLRVSMYRACRDCLQAVACEAGGAA